MELTCVRIILPVILFLAVFPGNAAEVPRSSVNPALLYWQAFSTMEELTAAETAFLGSFINRVQPFDQANARALLGKREKALNRFRKAAESGADCDWGLTYDEGPHLPLPHVSKIQTLSRLALLKAETLLAEHQTDEAMEWLLSVHRAARHCGSGELIIPVLSQFQLEQAVIRATAAHVLEWDAASRREYLSKWKSLPPLHTVKEAIKGELHFIAWLENYWLQGSEIKIPPELTEGAIIPGVDESAMTAEERAEAEKLVAQFTTENIRRWIQEMRDICQNMQTALDQPWVESHPALLSLQSAYKTGDNLLMRLASPMPLHKVNDLAYKTATCSTMLRAALEQGPLLHENNIGAYKDAYVGAPLMLTYTSDQSLLITISPETLKKTGVKIVLLLHPPKQE